MGIKRTSATIHPDEVVLPVPKRSKRHRFKTFRQRIDEVNIDVYKSLVPRRDTPLPGSSSFFHEKLIHWRELNAAHDWLECCSEVQQLSATLPQLVHHQEEILESLLKRLKMEYALSLEPILDLLSVLSRDLGADFLPHLETVLEKLCNLIVNQGADRDPEVLGHIFTSVSSICKHLARFLIVDLKPLMKMTSILRHHHSIHVRKFTADALGFLVRKAKDDSTKSVIEYLYSECAVGDQPMNVCHGNGEVLASSVKGVNYGLHSRCDKILGWVFTDYIESAIVSNAQISHKAKWFVVREVCALSCLEYVRSIKAAAPIWDAIMKGLEISMGKVREQHLKEKRSGMKELMLGLGRNICLVNVLLQHRHGKRAMADLSPLFSTVRELIGDLLISYNDDILGEFVDKETQLDLSMLKYMTPDAERGILNSIKLLLLLTLKRNGVGCMDLVITEYTTWRISMLEHLNSMKYLEFIASLLNSKLVDTDIPMVFLADSVDAVISCSLKSDYRDFSLAFFVDACSYMTSRGSSFNEAKMQQIEQFLLKIMQKSVAETDFATFWAAQICSKVAMRPSCGFYHASLQQIQQCQDVQDEELLALVSCICISIAEVYMSYIQTNSIEKGEFLGLIEKLLTVLSGNLSNIHCVMALSSIVQCGIFSTVDRLDLLLDTLSQNLLSPCKDMRIESLSIILKARKLSMNASELEALSYLHELETHPLGADSGRHAVVTLERIQNFIEYGKIPVQIVQNVLHGLMGLLHIRLSAFWGPTANTLATAINTHGDKAWHLFQNQLQKTQNELLHFGLQQETCVEVEDLRKHKLPSLSTQYSKYLCLGRNPSHSDPAARLSHLLKCLSNVNATILSRYWEGWMPLFISFARRHCQDGLSIEEEENHTTDQDSTAQTDIKTSRKHFSTQIWRSLLRDWMKVLLSLKSVRNLPGSERVLESVSQQLLDTDPLVQKTALNVLKLFKIEWLNPYLESLLKIVDNKTLRSELTAFPLAKESSGVRAEDAVLEILPEHRKGFVPVLIACLFPKMRKRSGRLGGKGAPGSARTAILNFLSGAEPEELDALLELFLAPLSPCFIAPDNAQYSDHERIYFRKSNEGLWWGAMLGKRPGEWWMHVIDSHLLERQPTRRQIGYLNAIDDILKHLGHKMTVYLPEICTLILRMMSLSVVRADVEGSKEVRIKSIRLLSFIFDTFPDKTDYAFLWNDLFVSTKCLFPKIPSEANGERSPALLELCKSISGHAPLFLALGISSGRELLQSCLSTLNTCSCAEPARMDILDIIESLFDHREDQVAGIDSVIEPHRATILQGLQAILERQKPGQQRIPTFRSKVSKQEKFNAKRSLFRALGILERMASDPRDSAALSQIIKALLPILSVPKRKMNGIDKRRNIDEDISSRALTALDSTWQRMGAMQLEKDNVLQEDVAMLLAPLVNILKTSHARACLCEAVMSLSKFHAHLKFGAKLLSDLNSMSANMLDEPDYDTRLHAYSKLRDPHSWSALIKSSNGISLMVLYQCCVDLRNGSDISLRHSSSKALKVLVDCFSEYKLPLDLAKKYLMPELRLHLASENISVRQEHLEIVRKVALSLTDSFPELSLVSHPDEEVDFWMNAAHMQLHRRSRAFSRLMKNVCKDHSLPRSLLRGYLYPLIEQAIVENAAVQNQDKLFKGHELKQGDLDRGANVTDAAIQLLITIGQGLEWSEFQQLLSRYLALMVKYADMPCMKSLIRTVSMLLETVSKRARVSETSEHDESELHELYGLLISKAIPNLKEKLVDGETVRTPVAMALVKVLKVLPQDYARQELPKILQTVCNLLKLRLQRLRDDARDILADMTKELGPMYLPFVIQVLRSSLPPRGFTAHVLGYTFHQVLQSVAPAARDNPGCLDCCIDQTLVIIEDDLFGETAEAKEASEFASSYKESKRCKANGSFEILASIISIEHSLPRLLEFVRSRLYSASSPRIRTKIQILLHHASKGILSNPTASPKSVIEMVYGVLEPIVRSDEQVQDSLYSETDGGQTASKMYQERDMIGNHLLAEFAVLSLLSCLKKGVISLNENTMSQLLPVLPLLLHSLGSRSTAVVTNTLQLINLVINSSFAEETLGMNKQTEIGKKVIKVLRKCPSALHPVAQEAFKALASIIRSNSADFDTKFLLQWSFTDLEQSTGDKQGAFTLLRAILGRRIVLPEVYDLMDQIQQLMIRSQSSQARQLSSSTLLQFLLDYPLGSKRMEHHLQFLLINLNYEHETGRKASLDMLETIIMKFPQEILSTWSDKIFLSMVTRLVNESSSSLRQQIIRCISSLLARCRGDVAKKLLSYCSKWLHADGDYKLQQASLVTLVGIMGMHQGRRPPHENHNIVMSAVEGQTGSVIQVLVRLVKQDSDEWETAYQALLFLEGIIQKDNGQTADCLESAASELWSCVHQCLLHRHFWVRCAAGRLVGHALFNSSSTSSENSNILKVVGCGALVFSFLKQLESNSCSEDMAAQAVRCLVFLSDIFVSLAENCSHAGESESEVSSLTTLHQLVRNMARLADMTSYAKSTQRNYALRYIPALVSKLGPVAVKPYLPTLMRPLYRILEPSQGMKQHEEITSLAQEIFAHVKSSVGTEELLDAYNKAREDVTQIRQERRTKAAIQAQVDPKAAARRKIRANSRKTAGKKKALEEVRRQRSVGIVVKHKTKRGSEKGKQ
eukprot:jgi/Picsp_1/3771/NSC_06606-R1_u3 snornp protein utp20